MKGMKMNFGQALEAMKSGEQVARNGWNGKGMFVYLVPTTEKLNAHFIIKNVNHTKSTWVPSVNDCLAEDWYVLATETQDKPCSTSETMTQQQRNVLNNVEDSFSISYWCYCLARI